MRSIGLTILILLCGGGTHSTAQEPAAERVANLRMQLFEIESKQNELKNRLLEIEENLKPENISRSLAGIGSTRPEELRAQRRRQLEAERKNVRHQLGQFDAQHLRIQSAILKADNEAYLESAGIEPASVPAKRKVVRHRSRRPSKTKGKKRKRPSVKQKKANTGPNKLTRWSLDT